LRLLKHNKYQMEEEQPEEIITETYELHNKDCLDQMKYMANDSVDLIFCDLPYAQTDCHWDTAIDMNLFWKEVMRIKKLHTPIFMTTTTKFGVSLINSAPKKCPFRYDIVWHKSKKVGFLSARKMPLRSHEMIYVFYERLPFYDLSSHTHKFLKKKDSTRKSGEGVYANRFKDEVKSKYDPKLPNSVVDEKGEIYKITKESYKTRKSGSYDPPLPNSIIHRDTIYGDLPQAEQYAESIGKDPKSCHKTQYDPPLPDSVIIQQEEDKKSLYGQKTLTTYKNKKGKRMDAGKPLYDPPLPDSIIKAEYKETTYGDIKMVDFKARKKGESRYDPPLPDSVIKSDCYESNKTDDSLRKGFRDKRYDPPLPDSIVKEEEQDRKIKQNNSNKGGLYCNIDRLEDVKYDPPLPVSVVNEEKQDDPNRGATMINGTLGGLYHSRWQKGHKSNSYEPPLPDSILKETKCEQYGCDRVFYLDENGNKIKEGQSGKNQTKYDPPLPVSIVNEPVEVKPIKPKSKASEHNVGYTQTGYMVKQYKNGKNYWSCLKPNEKYVPPALREPASDIYRFKERVESGELSASKYINEPPLPDSMLYVKSESGKHSTQKPVALMSWILKYYSKEGDVVLDPTAGSGSTGVACLNMKRRFIGIEMDKKIFGDAIKRLSEQK
jgi:16S rRNA G966 N2-methylase RsmD